MAPSPTTGVWRGVRVLLGSLPAALFSPGWEQLLTYSRKACQLVLRAALASPAPGGVPATLPPKERFQGALGSAERKACCMQAGRLAGCLLRAHLPHGQGLSGKGSQSLSLNHVAFVSPNSALWAERGSPKGLGQWESTPPCTSLPGDMPPSGQTRGVTGRCGAPLARACPPPRTLVPPLGDTGTRMPELCSPAAQGPGFLGESCCAAPRHVPVLTQKAGGRQQTGQGWSRAVPRHPAHCLSPGANGMSPRRQE